MIKGGMEQAMKIAFDNRNVRVLTEDNVIWPIKVEDYLYILDEINSIRMYLVIGKEKALLFDTGFGYADLRPIIKAITDLPLYVVCSHGHDDHIYGNDFFDTVHISAADFELAMSYDNEEAKDKLIRSRYPSTPHMEELINRESYMKRSIKNCAYEFMKDGDVFDLGGLSLVVYGLPGHTRGSVGLFCPQTKDFFSGDVLMQNHNFMYGHGIEWSAPPDQYIRGLSRIDQLDIERIWPAHGDVPAPKELLANACDMFADWAKDGDPERDLEKVGSIFGRACIYQYKDMTLAYHSKHLDEIRTFMKEHDGATQ